MSETTKLIFTMQKKPYEDLREICKRKGIPIGSMVKLLIAEFLEKELAK